MGCTHSKNSKSKSGVAKNEHPLERSLHHSRVAHFEETHPTTQSTSVEPEEPQMNHYTKNLLNETRESTHQNTVAQDKSAKKQDTKTQSTPTVKADQNITIPTQNKQQYSEAPADKMETAPDTALPPTVQQKQFVSSTYYPMPTVGEKQKSPEKKKTTKRVEQSEEKKKKKDQQKSAVIGPNYRPQLTPEDMEYIRRSVQQRNERRAYMMAHRNETDDTLYELELRMPEKDYTNRIEATQNSRVY
ncbi:hypothetical protein L5515_001033 [Caenorhabditis briggsae]|uniref:Uncharacterized protein n=1 Tax=Caenorhabditis briggsae TaxID=6238 RepID=A0AAE9DV81_CAEBR|nr:hypothetical protein L3Y34_014953 [Caenorhabditis briggsae]UMM12066.1 hypothetical protein L5515_001033 [Caenorhabditis briggsae]